MRKCYFESAAIFCIKALALLVEHYSRALTREFKIQKIKVLGEYYFLSGGIGYEAGEQ